MRITIMKQLSIVLTAYLAAHVVIVLALLRAPETPPEVTAALVQRVYCEMVETWLDDAAAGTPLEHRAGWPPFDGVTYCLDINLLKESDRAGD